LLPTDIQLKGIVVNGRLMPESDVVLSTLGVQLTTVIHGVTEPKPISEFRRALLGVYGRLAAAPYRFVVTRHRRDGTVTAKTEFLTEEELAALTLLNLDVAFGSAEKLQAAIDGLYIRINRVKRMGMAGDVVMSKVGSDTVELAFARQPGLTLRSLLSFGKLAFAVFEGRPTH
jgi:hypothetical protein